jgi:hypothetical protein
MWFFLLLISYAIIGGGVQTYITIRTINREYIVYDVVEIFGGILGIIVGYFTIALLLTDYIR